MFTFTPKVELESSARRPRASTRSARVFRALAFEWHHHANYCYAIKEFEFSCYTIKEFEFKTKV